MSLQTQDPVAVPLYAGFWRRAAAAFLDSIILIIPAVIINIAFVENAMIAFLLNLAVGAAYYATFHSSAKQATPGKMAFGIKVTTLDGERIGMGRGVGRYLATWLSTMILFIGFVMAGFTQKRQALHDMIAGTLVVNKKAEPAEVVEGGGTMPLTGGVIAMIAFFLVVPFFGGILAAIAIPAYSDYTVRAKIAEVLATATPLKKEIEQAYLEKRAFKTGDVTVSTRFAVGATVTPKGEIVIQLVPGVGNGGTILHTPIIDSAGAISWQCSSGNVPKRYLPLMCRG